MDLVTVYVLLQVLQGVILLGMVVHLWHVHRMRPVPCVTGFVALIGLLALLELCEWFAGWFLPHPRS